MSNNTMKIVLFLLFFTLMVHSSSCLLSKINTNIEVFGDYDENIGKLDIETKLTYVNLDTGAKNPVMGKELKIVVNVTVDEDTNYTIERYVLTNSQGWARRTFYLEEAQEFLVTVYFEGDSNFKESLGTLGGGGAYEQQLYTTSLPEGITLTTCLPIMVLIGFLGAAMYASGGNPFGFVDMSTTRGFRMNRNLRKTMFVQGIGGTIGSLSVSAIRAVMGGIAKSRTKAKMVQMKEGEEEKEQKPELEGKTTEGGTVNQAVNAPAQGKQVQEKGTQQGGKGQEAQLSKADQEKKIIAATVGEGFLAMGKTISILGSIFTGDTIMQNFLSNIVRSELRKNNLMLVRESKDIDELEHEQNIRIENGKDQIASAENIIEEANQTIQEAQKKLKEENLTPAQRRQFRKIIRGAQREVRSLETNIKKINNDINNAKEVLGSIEVLKQNLEAKGFENVGEISIYALKDMKLDPENDSRRGEIDSAIKEINSTFDTIVNYNENYKNGANGGYREIEEQIALIQESDLSDSQKEKLIEGIKENYNEYLNKLGEGIFNTDNIDVLKGINSREGENGVAEGIDLSVEREKLMSEEQKELRKIERESSRVDKNRLDEQRDALSLYDEKNSEAREQYIEDKEKLEKKEINESEFNAKYSQAYREIADEVVKLEEDRSKIENYYEGRIEEAGGKDTEMGQRIEREREESLAIFDRMINVKSFEVESRKGIKVHQSVDQRINDIVVNGNDTRTYDAYEKYSEAETNRKRVEHELNMISETDLINHKFRRGEIDEYVSTELFKRIENNEFENVIDAARAYNFTTSKNPNLDKDATNGRNILGQVDRRIEEIREDGGLVERRELRKLERERDDLKKFVEETERIKKAEDWLKGKNVNSNTGMA